MGVERPIVGFLSATTIVEPDAVASARATWAQPRIEPEIAYVTAHVIDRALRSAEVKVAIAGVTAAAEIIRLTFQQLPLSSAGRRRGQHECRRRPAGRGRPLVGGRRYRLTVEGLGTVSTDA
jgi:hypothetical protein